MEKEIRVFGVNSEKCLLTNEDIKNIPDCEFIYLSELQGLVWSLSGYQSDFNNSQLPYLTEIRFLNQ